MKIARRYLVSGKVQGVGFRYFVHQRARALGVCGFVRNLADGRVEVWAEGEEAPVLGLLDDIREGPPFSRVEDVHVEVLQATGRYSLFQITG